jgi:hypothetical protein
MKYLSSFLFIAGSIEFIVALLFFSSKEYGWAILQLFIAAIFFFLAIYKKTTLNKMSKNFIFLLFLLN